MVYQLLLCVVSRSNPCHHFCVPRERRHPQHPLEVDASTAAAPLLLLYVVNFSLSTPTHIRNQNGAMCADFYDLMQLLADPLPNDHRADAGQPRAT